MSAGATDDDRNRGTLVNALIELRMYVEATLDFPEEDIEFLRAGDVVAKLNAEVQAMAADSEFRDKVLGPYQMSPIASSPAEFSAFVKNEAATWKAIIERAKLQID